MSSDPFVPVSSSVRWSASEGHRLRPRRRSGGGGLAASADRAWRSAVGGGSDRGRGVPNRLRRRYLGFATASVAETRASARSNGSGRRHRASGRSGRSPPCSPLRPAAGSGPCGRPRAELDDPGSRGCRPSPKPRTRAGRAAREPPGAPGGWCPARTDTPSPVPRYDRRSRERDLAVHIGVLAVGGGRGGGCSPPFMRPMALKSSWTRTGGSGEYPRVAIFSWPAQARKERTAPAPPPSGPGTVMSDRWVDPARSVRGA